MFIYFRLKKSECNLNKNHRDILRFGLKFGFDNEFKSCLYKKNGPELLRDLPIDSLNQKINCRLT